MSRDVFPAPVGPTIKLSFPRLKKSSSSTRSINTRRRVPPGVTACLAESLAQVKDAWRKPIVF